MATIYEQEYKTNALRAAKDLGYGKKVVEKILAAKNDDEITIIMATAREEKFG